MTEKLKHEKNIFEKYPLLLTSDCHCGLFGAGEASTGPRLALAPELVKKLLDLGINK